MKKRLLPFILMLAMVFSTLAIPAVADTEPTGIYDVASYDVVETKTIRDKEYDVIEIDEEKYVVIGTAAEFLNLRHKIDGSDDLILNDGYNYILKNDIDLDDTVFGTFHGLSLRNGAVFEGNGFSLTGLSFHAVRYGIGLFIAANDDSQFTVRNLTLGGANGEEIVCTATGNKGGVIVGEAVAAAALTLENVTIYVNTEVTALHWLSAFIGTNNGTVVMNDCKAYGTIKTTGGSVGGFVGDNKGTVTLTNCINSVQISADQNVGALVGNGTATVNSCYSTVNDYTFTPYAGGDKGTYNMNGAAFVNELDDATKNVFLQYRVTEGAENKKDYRVLVSVDASVLNGANDIEFTVDFTLANNGHKVAVLDEETISYYKIVMAAGEYYMSSEGKILLAVVISGVPDAEWTEMSVNLTVDSDAIATASTTKDALLNA